MWPFQHFDAATEVYSRFNCCDMLLFTERALNYVLFDILNSFFVGQTFNDVLSYCAKFETISSRPCETTASRSEGIYHHNVYQ